MNAKQLDLAQFEGHTSGPWELDASSLIAQFEGEEVQLASMSRTHWSTDSDGTGKNVRLANQNKLNARLIAAAPTLLTECKRLREENDRLREALAEALSFQIANMGTQQEFYCCYTMEGKMPSWVGTARAALKATK